MKPHVPLIAMLAVTAVIAGPAGPTAGADAAVSVEDDRFVPHDSAVLVGGQVTWTRAPGSTGPHNVRQDDRLFRSGPVTEGPIAYAARFSAGSFHYYCEAHGSQVGGMDGVVRVPPTVDPAPSGRRFTVIWATNETSTGSRFDVEFRRGGGRWLDWKENARAERAVFGKRGQPERAHQDARYRFRVRSQSGDAVSRWSPVATLRVSG